MIVQTVRATSLNVALTVMGSSLLLLLWMLVKYALGISDRYLPSPMAVITAARDIEPSILVHAAATMLRLIIGGTLGVMLGVGGAVLIYSSPAAVKLFMPSIHAIRSVPPVATVPFFLLWFGFEESGKLVLILLGIGLNVLVAAHQILVEIPAKYQVALSSFGHDTRTFPLQVSLPLVAERILPTVRTSTSIAFGVVMIAELLGSQQGLGYLVQTSRTTYAIHVIFLATIVLGLLSIITDRAIVVVWNRGIFWNRTRSRP